MTTPDVGHGAFAVSGASGAVGGRVAARLASLGHSQILIVRDRGRAPNLLGAEAVQASYEHPQEMRRALAGVGTFFMGSGRGGGGRPG